jgi:oligopeptide transport system substrate-binding protein
MNFIMWVIMSCLVACQTSPSGVRKSHSEIRVNIAGEPATLDPRKGADLLSSSLHFILFEGLTRLRPDGTIALAGAESIDISDDRLTYTFHLRDTKWSDGTPVTAYDYETSWKQILDPRFPAANAHLFYPIKEAAAAKKGRCALEDVGIHSRDNKTLIVELENPTPYFLELTAFCVFFPVNRSIDRKFPDWAYHSDARFVSNGPFKMSSWKHREELVFDKNPEYWQADQITLNTIKLSMISDEMTALHMYEHGELDLIGMPFSPLPADALSHLSTKETLKTQPVAGSTICVFNTNTFPFQNLNMRKAFALAMNRASIVENITQLGEEIATGIIPPVLKNHSSSPFYTDNDVKQARAHFEMGLKELGISADDLHGITYHYNTTELHQKVAQALQHQWYEVLGVKIKLVSVEHKVLLDKLAKREITFAQTIWLAQYSDQMNILERYASKENVKNYAGWENSQFKTLLDQSALESDPAARRAALLAAEQLFVDEMPVAPIYHSTFAFLMKPEFKNGHLSMIGGFYFDLIGCDP